VSRDSVTNLVIGVVVVMWATSAVVGMLKPGYQIPGTLQLLMTAVASFLFGDKILTKAEKPTAPPVKTPEGKQQ
jgi:hypothetical protein